MPTALEPAGEVPRTVSTQLDRPFLGKWDDYRSGLNRVRESAHRSWQGRLHLLPPQNDGLTGRRCRSAIRRFAVGC